MGTALIAAATANSCGGVGAGRWGGDTENHQLPVRAPGTAGDDMAEVERSRDRLIRSWRANYRSLRRRELGVTSSGAGLPWSLSQRATRLKFPGL